MLNEDSVFHETAETLNAFKKSLNEEMKKHEQTLDNIRRTHTGGESKEILRHDEAVEDLKNVTYSKITKSLEKVAKSHGFGYDFRQNKALAQMNANAHAYIFGARDFLFRSQIGSLRRDISSAEHADYWGKILVSDNTIKQLDEMFQRDNAKEQTDFEKQIDAAIASVGQSAV